MTFTNKGRNQHNVIPLDEAAFARSTPRTSSPAPRPSPSTSPGDYAYYCSLHGTPTKGMIGAIRVLE